MADDALQLDPTRVNKFLQDELNGSAPAEVVDFVNRMRKDKPGMFPPPIFPDTGVGRVNTTGRVQKRQVTTPSEIPDPGSLDVGSGRPLGFMRTVPEVVSGVKKAGSAMLDPEVIGATGGGIIGGMYGSPIIGAGLGAAGMAAGRDIFENTSALVRGDQIPHPPMRLGIDTGSALVSGMVGEGAGKVLTAIGPAARASETGIGRETGQFFKSRGVPTMANQVTDSTPLNFMANVAKHGPGGKRIINEVEQQQSAALKDYLTETAHSLNPTGTLNIDPSTGALDLAKAGRQVQTDIATQVKAAPKTSGYPEFFEKHGEKRATKIVQNAAGDFEKKPVGPTVAEAHKARSEALAYGRNQNISRADRQAAMKEADISMGKLNKALDSDTARQEYQDIAKKYNIEINRVDNPTAEALRTGPTNDVVDDILGSKLKNYENLSTGTGHSNEELLTKIQKAATPEAWAQLQSDTVYRAAERALDPKTGMLDFNQFNKILADIDQGTKKTLFGPGLQDINRAAAMLKQAQKYHSDEAGRLFIAIRTGGAITSGATGILTGNVGKGLLGAATILGMPTIFAKILTSETARPLLVRALGKNPTIKESATKALVKWAAQNITEAGREAVVGETSKPAKDDNVIPEPPQ